MMDRNARGAGFTLCSAMVAALLGGCSGHASLASADKAQVSGRRGGEAGQVTGDVALAKAEARVAKARTDGAARADLAQTYLAAGRFASAATTFEDAVTLGNTSARTGLGLALAYIGSGRNAEAQAALARWQAQLPASDYGLALALAGQPAAGVEALSAALRAGANTPKMRQNLAYAYALDGRWAEARVVAMQDVPADQIDARLAEWAASDGADTGRMRIAAMLGTEVRSDPGQPTALALNRPAVAAPALAAVEAPMPPQAAAELPAVAQAQPQAAPEAAVLAQAPAVAPKLAARPAMEAANFTPPRTSIERAFDHGIAKAQAPRPAAKGNHVVQLGSFGTMEGAKRAWAIFQRRDPSLRGHALRITEANVNGRRYFRVAAENFARGSAQSLCSGVKQRGGECFAYEAPHAQPGTAPKGKGPQLALR
ncbi:SPOR domain-containing protein [Novosphingobium sp. Leaf2]|uniref:SPOR domain-containing protein n=1 Tax=Novosphingobium sp. Leaf2 TaxID=1735670 RepID=UPI0006FA9DD5|nr:tetratricopeptide repeat protein [Novosphingobium sp. Leaf2]KQM18746.1 sporulation protein [Novosphingobium sp. Leaf2]